MAILAGEIVSAGRLGWLQPTTYAVTPSGPLVLSTSVQDIPGCSITLTTATANAGFAVTADVDCVVTTVNTTTLIEARLVIDGVDQAGRTTYAMDTLDRGTVAGLWDGTLGSAGSHTFKLVAAMNGAGAGSIQSSNTKLRVVITEVV